MASCDPTKTALSNTCRRTDGVCLVLLNGSRYCTVALSCARSDAQPTPCSGSAKKTTRARTHLVVGAHEALAEVARGVLELAAVERLDGSHEHLGGGARGHGREQDDQKPRPSCLPQGEGKAQAAGAHEAIGDCDADLLPRGP